MWILVKMTVSWHGNIFRITCERWHKGSVKCSFDVLSAPISCWLNSWPAGDLTPPRSCDVTVMNYPTDNGLRRNSQIPSRWMRFRIVTIATLSLRRITTQVGQEDGDFWLLNMWPIEAVLLLIMVNGTAKRSQWLRLSENLITWLKCHIALRN